MGGVGISTFGEPIFSGQIFGILTSTGWTYPGRIFERRISKEPTCPALDLKARTSMSLD